MKHKTATETADTPAVFTLLPEDRFFQSAADLQRLIARRAYELFAEKGFQNSHELEDWLQAESQLLKSVPLDVSETESALTLKAALPEYGANDVEIHVEPKRLFVTGQHQQKSKEKEAKTSYFEQRLFCSLELPAEIDPDQVKATLSNGELRIDLPKVKVGLKDAVSLKAAA
jgi:HSP20 family protein